MLIAAVLRPSDDQPTDRRAFRRHSVNLGASFEFDGTPNPVSCLVVDVSAGGAQIMGRLPETVVDAKLEIEGFEPLACRVIWRTDNKAGLRFLNDPKDIAARLAQYIKGGG